MSLFSHLKTSVIDEICEHFAEKLEVTKSAVKKAIKSFGESTDVSVSSSETESVVKKPKKQVRSSGDDEKHLCERIKRGQSEPCGKNAKRSIENDDGELAWYCGGEKSGCYSIALKASKQTSLPPEAKKSTDTSPLKTNEERKKYSDLKSKELLKKVNKKEEIKLMKVHSDKYGDIYIHKTTKVVFDSKKEEAYGVYDMSEDQINEIDDENIRWLEANSVKVREKEEELLSDSSDEFSDDE